MSDVKLEWARYERFATLAGTISRATETSYENAVRFAGGSKSEAVRWGTHGWPEGVAEAQRIGARIANRVIESSSADGIDLCADVVGAAYDTSAYIAGVPECWLMPAPNRSRRAVSICINCVCSGGIEARTLRQRGIASLALVLALNARGYPVTVDVAQVANSHRARSGGGPECLVTRVADASTGSQLDMDRLAFALGHPTMFRQIFASVTGDYWGPLMPMSNDYPDDTTYDLKIGGAHLNESERWTDGGEAWVLAEYNRQTA